MLLQWQLSELVVCVPDTNTHTHLIYIQPNFLKKGTSKSIEYSHKNLVPAVRICIGGLLS